MVRSLHAPEDLLPAGTALAREFADNCAPVSIALTRQLIWRSLGAQPDVLPSDGHPRGSVPRRSTDPKEDVAAFHDKGPPHFSKTVGRNVPDTWPGVTPLP